MKIKKEQIESFLSEYNDCTVSVIQQTDMKIIATVEYVQNELKVKAYFKSYDVEKYNQIERVYTILDLLKTKLSAEAKKNNEVFVNLLPEIYKMGKIDNYFFVLEECIVGKTLSESIRMGEYKSFLKFIQLMKQICDAVEMVHKPFPTIVHCDIKEQNIYIDAIDNVVKLIDFDAAYIEGSGDYSVVRGTRGYCPSELVNSAPVAQSDIYSIGRIMENIVEKSDYKVQLDSQGILKLESIIEKSKGELKQRYDDVHELKEALSELEMLFIFKENMKKLDDYESISVYSYADDSSGMITMFKSQCTQQLTAFTDVDILYLATYENKSVAYTMTGLYYYDQVNKKMKFMPYDEIVACIYVGDEYTHIIECISKKTTGQWEKEEIEVPKEAVELICNMMNDIVLYKHSHYSKENIANYYSKKCQEAYDNLVKRELDQKRNEFDFWWDVVTYIGNHVWLCESNLGRSHCSCEAILLKVYSNKERFLRHRIKDGKEYGNDSLINQVRDCIEKEKRYGASDSDERLQEFERRITSKRQEQDNKKIFKRTIN